MSYEAERWARAQVVGNSTAKYVLRELACCHNGKTGLCCPSISTLCKVLEIKKDETVLKAITHLEARGLLARTFERGDKGNITRTLYRFPTFSKEEWLGNALQKTEYGYSEIQSTVLQKKEEGTPENGEGGSDFGGYGCSEKRSVTMNIEQVKEQVSNNKESSLSRLDETLPLFDGQPQAQKDEPKQAKKTRTKKPNTLAEKPDDVDEQVWNDFLTVRKAKRAPVTPTAVEGIQREAQKAGISLNEAIKVIVTRGWQGFSNNYGWKTNSQPQRQTNRPLSRERMALHDDF